MLSARPASEGGKGGGPRGLSTALRSARKRAARGARYELTLSCGLQGSLGRRESREVELTVVPRRMGPCDGLVACDVVGIPYPLGFSLRMDVQVRSMMGRRQRELGFSLRMDVQVRSRMGGRRQELGFFAAHGRPGAGGMSQGG